ncbi:MAG TPA: NADPH-dependent glutamate synthase [Candidatus Pullichristensenella excrementigallinarum]|uniref:NADPH-dependent glutamate synthase n=1 Tax=Candidatus Pullichristensenella excrementigallinarum TaxID=2840907 RepID=A0A9D1ID55_9FIRM|nr:NADPH-dependent glutamate synthase [Candidatus Pullichristensenella excrementigallinarum]
MYNKSLVKLPAREQAPEVRRRNFQEVSQGYDEAMALEEATRCIGCKNAPCMTGCPVNVHIPEFIAHVKAGEFDKAYDVIRQTNSLPAICGRVCPQENQCESKCVRGIKGDPVGIGRLERFCADYAMAHKRPQEALPEKNGKRVAVVGSGPSGLTCAGDLAKKGYDVTIYEALHTPGGVLVYGIPEFRLPKSLVREEIRTVEALGVKIETNVVVGRSVTLEELFEEGFSAIYIGSGAGLPRFQKIPGENLNGVYSANEFLTRVNLMKAYSFPQADTPVRVGKKVAVIGGGNVAMDAARSAMRLGAEEVSIVYRRSEKEMPARLEEVHHAKEEGVIFRMLTNPTRILGDERGSVTGMEVVEMELGEPDASGRRRPVVKEGSEYTLEVDTVVVAIGNSPNPLIRDTTPGLATQKWGGLIVDEETGATSLENVYAGGDAVTGAATVILAMGAGKTAAKAIDEKLSGK